MPERSGAHVLRLAMCTVHYAVIKQAHSRAIIMLVAMRTCGTALCHCKAPSVPLRSKSQYLRVPQQVAILAGWVFNHHDWRPQTLAYQLYVICGHRKCPQVRKRQLLRLQVHDITSIVLKHVCGRLRTVANHSYYPQCPQTQIRVCGHLCQIAGCQSPSNAFILRLDTSIRGLIACERRQTAVIAASLLT